MKFAGMSMAQSSFKEKEKEEEEKKKNKQKTKETSTKKVTGGSGMIGGIIEAGAGFVDRNAAKKAARRAESRPEHRRLAKGLDQFKERGRKREVALSTLSQAVMDWAASIR